MKVVRGAGGLEPSQAAIFEGSVTTRTLVDEAVADKLRLTVVHFDPGGRTRLHTHTCEQLLYVTAGRGTLATEQDQYEVTPGDAIVVPAGERHWHGAGPATSMTHLSILTPCTTEIVERDEG